MDNLIKVSIVILCIQSVLSDNFNTGYIDVTEYYPFAHQSALKKKENLKSQEYQDFIHQLYSHDKDNLKKVDNLFAHPELADSTNIDPVLIASNTNFRPNSYRQAREIVFRPLFVYKQQGIHRRRVKKNNKKN